MGSFGYVRDYDVEKYWRDCKIIHCGKGAASWGVSMCAEAITTSISDIVSHTDMLVRAGVGHCFDRRPEMNAVLVVHLENERIDLWVCRFSTKTNER